MILGLVLCFCFISALISLIHYLTTSNNTYDTTKQNQAIALAINTIFIIIFAISLYKQTIISGYPVMTHYILMWLIFDRIMGTFHVINKYGQETITVGVISKIYRIISAVITMTGILFIWL